MHHANTKFTIIIPPQNISCDQGCLQRLAGGDRDAYAWVYKNYSRKVYDYVMLMTQDEALSEDIVHDVFMRLWMHREKLATVENFNGYLYRLQKNLVIEILKRRKMELNVREHFALDNLSSSDHSFDVLETKEKKDFLENAVMQLPQQQQVVFRLSKEDGWKRMKIAGALKISPFTVKCHLQKAVKSLRLRVRVME